jgi:hypothetical protein
MLALWQQLKNKEGVTPIPKSTSKKTPPGAGIKMRTETRLNQPVR